MVNLPYCLSLATSLKLFCSSRPFCEVQGPLERSGPIEDDVDLRMLLRIVRDLVSTILHMYARKRDAEAVRVCQGKILQAVASASPFVTR